jgi:hypothetical protein
MLLESLVRKPVEQSQRYFSELILRIIEKLHQEQEKWRIGLSSSESYS